MGFRLALRRLMILLAAAIVAVTGEATPPNTADQSMVQFLAQDDAQPQYRAVRRLEAQNGSRAGWLEAATTFAPPAGFTYRVIAEGGSGYIRTRVLKALLDGERDVIEHGEAARSSLAPINYAFHANGIDRDGLANVLLSPRRKERVLVAGTMFLRPVSGDLVRLEGRLAKSPSFWIKNVDLVRTYDRIGGVVVPIALETKAQVRFLGEATLRMTYTYLEVDGRQVAVEP